MRLRNRTGASSSSVCIHRHRRYSIDIRAIDAGEPRSASAPDTIRGRDGPCSPISIGYSVGQIRREVSDE